MDILLFNIGTEGPRGKKGEKYRILDPSTEMEFCRMPERFDSEYVRSIPLEAKNIWVRRNSGARWRKIEYSVLDRTVHKKEEWEIFIED